jgi:hypothetical protein
MSRPLRTLAWLKAYRIQITSRLTLPAPDKYRWRTEAAPNCGQRIMTVSRFIVEVRWWPNTMFGETRPQDVSSTERHGMMDLKRTIRQPFFWQSAGPEGTVQYRVSTAQRSLRRLPQGDFPQPLQRAALPLSQERHCATIKHTASVGSAPGWQCAPAHRPEEERAPKTAPAPATMDPFPLGWRERCDACTR